MHRSALTYCACGAQGEGVPSSVGVASAKLAMSSEESHMSNYSQVQVDNAKDSSRSYNDETSPLLGEAAKTRERVDSCKRYDHSTRY